MNAEGPQGEAFPCQLQVNTECTSGPAADKENSGNGTRRGVYAAANVRGSWEWPFAGTFSEGTCTAKAMAQTVGGTCTAGFCDEEQRIVKGVLHNFILSSMSIS
jgi:hypothetical protein